MSLSNIGLIGLAVMGSNLARNIASRDFSVVVYNRSVNKTKEFIKQFGNEKLVGAYDYKEFISQLKRPRQIIIMVKAGAPVDGVIADILPYLEAGDILVDGGNSYYRDTQRRCKLLQEKKIQFVGCGVSGGEEGALRGPSLMPGGDKAAYEELRLILETIAAKDFSGKPCVTHIGEDGAGHYVKMVHNGIEYAVMQLMAESYALLTTVYKQTPEQIGKIFKTYNKGKLRSFLFEIAVPVLTRRDDLASQLSSRAESRDPLTRESQGSSDSSTTLRSGRNDKGYLIDKILDRAGAKGTGQWTSVDALERGLGIPSITESVFARSISAAREDRLLLSKLYGQKLIPKKIAFTKFQKLLENALYAAFISCYAQGYTLIQKAAAAEGWQIDLGEVSRIWEGGCIIRADLLNVLHRAYQKSGSGSELLLAIPNIVTLIKKHVPALRQLAAFASITGVSISAFATSLFYIQDMTTERLPANFIQGLRDYFGAHTYERVDRPGSFHTEWNN